ncbi:MAG: hypothetical protein R3Y21_05755 [Mycoplasmatota bacterium]
MDIVLPEELINIFTISLFFSTIMMVTIQKLKSLTIINKKWHIWVLDLFLSFAMGIPFSMQFYEFSIYEGVWVGIFTFVGAPAIYDALKKQKIINFTPESMTTTSVEIPKENIISR